MHEEQEVAPEGTSCIPGWLWDSKGDCGSILCWRAAHRPHTFHSLELTQGT